MLQLVVTVPRERLATEVAARVNDRPWGGHARRCLRCVAVRAEPGDSLDTLRLTARFDVNPSGHAPLPGLPDDEADFAAVFGDDPKFDPPA